MKKKGNRATDFPDGELQCFVGTREVGKRVSKNQNGSNNISPTKRLSDILLMRRFIRGAAQRKGIDVADNDDGSNGLDRRTIGPRFSDNGRYNHRLVGQSASSMSSASTNTNLRTNSSSLLMSTNSSSVSGSGGYFPIGGGGRYTKRNSSVRSGTSCYSAKSNATALTAVSSLAGSSSICSSASAAAAYKKGMNKFKLFGLVIIWVINKKNRYSDQGQRWLNKNVLGE